MISSSLSYWDCIQKVDILSKNITVDYFKQIENSINIFKCKKGQQFILEGAPVNGLFFICAGKAKVLKTGIFGKEQILRLVGEGEIIGYRGFGTREKYGISAVALEDCVLCNFTNNLMEKMLREIPGLTYDLMLFYAEELNRSEAKVKSLAQMTVREKVIDTILYMERKFGSNSKGFLNLRLSRREIADFAGTTDEQVIRTISTLKKENQMVVLGKQIGIVNVSNLKKDISEHNYYLDS